MTNDLISREALKKAIDNAYKEYDGYDPNDLVRFAERVDEEIDNAPTVCEMFGDIPEFHEPKKGEWGEPFFWNGKTYHKCMNCCISTELILIDKYCPNCGAKMGVEENECI